MIIVHALKSVPQRVPKHPLGVVFVRNRHAWARRGEPGLFFLGGEAFAHAAWMVLGCSIVLFVCPILFWILPVIRAKRAPDGSLPTFREAPRQTIGFAGVLLLFGLVCPHHLTQSDLI